jgi:hypothetical protein
MPAILSKNVNGLQSKDDRQVPKFLSFLRAINAHDPDWGEQHHHYARCKTARVGVDVITGRPTIGGPHDRPLASRPHLRKASAVSRWLGRVFRTRGAHMAANTNAPHPPDLASATKKNLGTPNTLTYAIYRRGDKRGDRMSLADETAGHNRQRHPQKLDCREPTHAPPCLNKTAHCMHPLSASVSRHPCNEPAYRSPRGGGAATLCIHTNRPVYAPGLRWLCGAEGTAATARVEDLAGRAAKSHASNRHTSPLTEKPDPAC